MGHGTLAVDVLRRTKATPALGKLGKKARAKVLAGAIELDEKNKDRVANANILLVDDVLTSGATSSACVNVLRKAGANSVKIACFTRVLDEALNS